MQTNKKTNEQKKKKKKKKEMKFGCKEKKKKKLNLKAPTLYSYFSVFYIKTNKYLFR
jgi:hypothetical protein